MPMYEYRCPRGHVTELFQFRPDGGPKRLLCFHEVFDGIDTSLGKISGLGSTCRRDAEKIVSVPYMDPDPTWADGVDSLSLGKHFSSRKEMKDYAKQKGITGVGSGTDADKKIVQQSVDAAKKSYRGGRAAAIERHVGEVVGEHTWI